MTPEHEPIDSGAQALPKEDRINHWATLHPADWVEVWCGNSYSYIGYVDDRTDDGQIVWVIEDGTSTRRLYTRADTVELYRA